MDECLGKIINLLPLTQATDQQGPSLYYRKEYRSTQYEEDDDGNEMEVENFNMTQYHQTVQTVETVEIIDTDHLTVANTEDRTPHQDKNHMILRTQQDSEQQNQDTNWLQRTGDSQTKPNNTPIVKQRNITDPYRPRSGTRHQHRTDSSTAPTHLTILNAYRTLFGTRGPRRPYLSAAPRSHQLGAKPA